MEFKQFEVGDYVTAIAWDRKSKAFGVTTAVGAIVLVTRIDPPHWQEQVLRSGNGDAVGAIGFSGNGQYLAAAGQAGQVWIWEEKRLIATLDFSGHWIDHLVWHPSYQGRLAIGVGKEIVIWNGKTQVIEQTLDFAVSSVLGLAWTQAGDRLTAAGNRVVKSWEIQDWQRPPEILALDAASGSIAWSQGDRYFASGNFDRTVWVTEGSTWDTIDPWQMSGFPVKVSAIAWSHVSNPPTDNSAMTQNPVLAAVSGNAVALWNRMDDTTDWSGDVAIVHEGRVNGIAWHPTRLQLATAGSDGKIFLWDRSGVQEIESREVGWSTIAWSPDGTRLVGGGMDGTVWMREWG
jgi:WD40 repeat protein